MCRIDGCNSKPKSRGLCSRHYERFRLGKPLVLAQEPRLRGSGGPNGDGYIYHGSVSELEHRMIAAVAMGRTLKSNEFVHHIDENPSNNTPTNLVVCSPSYHKLLHRRMRAFEACGHYDWVQCWICKEWASPSSPNISQACKEGGASWHKSCAASRQRDLRSKG